MALSYKARRRWSLFILVIGLPAYIALAWWITSHVRTALDLGGVRGLRRAGHRLGPAAQGCVFFFFFQGCGPGRPRRPARGLTTPKRETPPRWMPRGRAIFLDWGGVSRPGAARLSGRPRARHARSDRAAWGGGGEAAERLKQCLRVRSVSVAFRDRCGTVADGPKVPVPKATSAYCAASSTTSSISTASLCSRRWAKPFAVCPGDRVMVGWGIRGGLGVRLLHRRGRRFHGGGRPARRSSTTALPPAHARHSPCRVRGS